MQKTKKKFNSVTSEKKAQIFTSEKRFISYLFQKYKHLTYLFDLPTFAMTIINMSKFPPFFSSSQPGSRRFWLIDPTSGLRTWPLWKSAASFFHSSRSRPKCGSYAESDGLSLCGGGRSPAEWCNIRPRCRRGRCQ